MEINNSPYKEFKRMTLRTLRKLGSTIEKLRKNFRRELENIIKNQSKIQNTRTEMESTLKGIDSRFNKEEQSSDWKTKNSEKTKGFFLSE